MTIPGFKALAPLDYIDTSNFATADSKEQEVCDFVLALALVHNDLKDLLWAFGELKNHSPKGDEISPEAGQINGMRTHCARLLYALHHELLELVAKNPAPQSHEAFLKVLARISKSSRDQWGLIVTAANGKPAEGILSRLLLKVRNNIAFHYHGLTALSRGFMEYYDGPVPARRNLYVSRGRDPLSSRFYFVDGAAQGAFENLARDTQKEEVADPLGDLTAATLHATNAIVLRFMEDRAGAWKRDA